MRKITEQAVNAFKAGVNFSSGNTKVEVRNGESFMYLHNNMIAHKTENELFITHCGWATNTTKERLNGVLRAFNIPQISQRNWNWYWGNEFFDGKKLFKLNRKP